MNKISPVNEPWGTPKGICSYELMNYKIHWLLFLGCSGTGNYLSVQSF